MRRPRLYLDLETRSCVDLRKTGVYRYAADPTTDVILAAWAVGAAQPRVWYRREPIPAELRDALEDPLMRISAHNFTFERQLILHVLAPVYGWPDVHLERWDCTMARARAAGLPASLEGALAALGSKDAKDAQGQALMLRMCRPRGYGPAGRPIWWDDEARIARLAEYCCRDVMGGRALDGALPQLDDLEREVWLETESMNDHGVAFDLEFADAGITVAHQARTVLDRRMHRVTRGAVPNCSRIKDLKRWLIAEGVEISPPAEIEDANEMDGDADIDEEEGERLPDLRRPDIIRLLSFGLLPDHAREALKLRLEANKTSVRKLDKILQRADDDGRVRGLLGYHGASTGRFAATGGVQIQNFPRDVVADWERCYATMLSGGHDALEREHGPVLELLSRMLRGAIIAGPGMQLLNADYSSVEAVGVAWLAGCEHLVQAFRDKAKIYEEMGARVFDLDPSTVAKDSLPRFVGKTLVLGAGYGMGHAKFRLTCAAQGRVVTEELAQRGIYTYRDTYPEIPELWRSLERAAMRAVRAPGTVFWGDGAKRVGFLRENSWLRMRLPSGRQIRYYRPAIEPDERFGGDKLTYWGTAGIGRKWSKQSTYGGRLCENAVQGLCRDLMVMGMLRLRAAGYRLVTTVHDEIIAELPRTSNMLGVEHAIGLMCELPDWAAGFPLSAEGRMGLRYRK